MLDGALARGGKGAERGKGSHAGNGQPEPLARALLRSRMLDVDWETLLVPTGSLAEIAVRGTIVYLALFVAMRLLPRREIGGMGAADILVIVIIADAVQNAMAGGYESITEGLLLAAVIFGWASLIDWLDYRFPGLHIAAARPLQVIRRGRMIHRNMKRDKITEDEVLAQLRQHGIASASEVEAAYIEGDGHFSVIRRGAEPMRPAPKDGATRG